jgi:hypothetical protein
VQEAFVALAESSAVGLPAWGRDGRVAEAWVMIEDRRAAGVDVAVGGLEAIVVALLLDGLVIQGRRRWTVDRLGMGASGQECGYEDCSHAKELVHFFGLWSRNGLTVTVRRFGFLSS